MFKNQKGITLISMVVAIIIMIILASVSIGNLIGENGLLNRVLEAKQNEKAKAAQEEVLSAITRMEYYELAAGDKGSKLRTLMNSSNLQKYVNGRINGYVINGDTTTIYYTNDSGSFTITIQYPGQTTVKNGIFVYRINNDSDNKLNTVQIESGETVTLNSEEPRHWGISGSVDDSLITVDSYTGEVVCKVEGTYEVFGFKVKEDGTEDETEEPIKVVIEKKPKAYEAPRYAVTGETGSEGESGTSSDPESPSRPGSMATIPAGIRVVAEFDVGNNVVAKYLSDYTMHICKKEGVDGDVNWTLASKYAANGVDFSGVEELNRITEENTTDIVVNEGINTIPDNAFNRFTGVTTLTLPESLTKLGNIIPSKENGLCNLKTLYFNCKSLSSIASSGELVKMDAGRYRISLDDWPTNSIGKTDRERGYVEEWHAWGNFYPSILYRSKIKNVIFGDKVERIPNYTFTCCFDLGSIVLPSTLNSIGKQAFANCTKITELTIPEGNLTTISEEAFRNTGITELDLPSNIRTLDTWCFRACRNLQNIDIPGTVITVGTGAFNECISIENIIINEGTQYLGNSAFSYCVSCKNVVFNVTSSLKSLKTSCLSGLCHVESIIIPDCVTDLKGMVIDRCKHLKTIKFPKNLTECGGYSYCDEVVNVTWPEVDFKFVNCSFYGDTFETFNIPNNCVGMKNAWLWHCDQLKTLNFGTNVKSINGHTVSCDKLVNINLNEGLESICEMAFQGCSNLTSIKIPSTVTDIDEDAFKNCSKLKTININQPSTSELNTSLKPWVKEHSQTITVKWSDGVTETF